jgi:hypothetical protein
LSNRQDRVDPAGHDGQGKARQVTWMTCLTLADLQQFCPLTLGLVSQYIEGFFFFTKGKWPGIRNKLYFGVQTMVSSQKQPQLMPCTTEVQKEWAAGHSSGAST